MFAFQFNGLNRSAELRQDKEKLQQLLQASNSYFLPAFEQTLLIAEENLQWLSLSQLQEFETTVEHKHLIYLGECQNCHYFSYRVKDQQSWLTKHPTAEFIGLRPLLKTLAQEQAYLANVAIGLNHWHQTHQYCNQCASPSYASQLGFVRHCSNPACGLEHFPRTDPAVICAISYQDKILLGRQQSWSENNYSVIAGFVEPGESLEQAVAREALEETGVHVDNIQYFSSQPWPFPQSLMVGFTARAIKPEIKLQDQELEDARWFSRNQIQTQISTGQLNLPQSYSISRSLIDNWLAQKL